MRKATNALLKSDSQVTAILPLPGPKKLRSVKTEDTTTAECPFDEEGNETLDLDEMLATHSDLAALTKENERQRKDLNMRVDSAHSRIHSAEQALIDARRSNVLRRKEISELRRRTNQIQEGQKTHDLFFREIHQVHLPALNTTLDGQQRSINGLQYQIDTLSMRLNRQIVEERQIASSGFPGWAIAAALAITAIGTGLIIALI